ncbi:MAG: DUF2461 domain-containing protein [Saprospiraceae bacterium]
MQTHLSPATFQFLRDLKANNDRDWFTEHKPRYQTAHADVVAFAETLLDKMSHHDELVKMTGKKSIFRIYRDVRFSKNKQPYKSNFAGQMKRATKWKRGGYYYHFEPGNVFLAGGFWAPERDDLKRIRQEIATDAQPLRDIISDAKFQKAFGELTGDQLKTAPRDYPKDHPNIDLLRYKQFIVTQNFTDEEVFQADFADKLIAGFVAMRPFFNYMSEVLTTDANGVPIE